MPKRRSKRKTYSTPVNITSVDNLFSSLRTTKEKMTKIELSNLEKNTKAAFNNFLYKACPEYNTCKSNFFEQLVSDTEELPNNYSSTLKFWILRIFYLYETIDSFSKESGENYLKDDKGVDWGNTFQKISNAIKKPNFSQGTIDRYKQNLFNLRNNLVSNSTSEDLFAEFLTKITFPTSGLPISAISDLKIEFAKKIKELDAYMFTNIKQGMLNPYNVVDDSMLKQMDTSQILTNYSLHSGFGRLPAPEVKLLAGSTGGIFPNRLADWSAGFGLGVAVPSLVMAGIAGYCFFKKRNQQQLPDTSTVEANHEFTYSTNEVNIQIQVNSN
ncbi:MAG: hypothetical protein RLY40_288 [Pseudomonadota bacterium]|jgi:hypothetical protein